MRRLSMRWSIGIIRVGCQCHHWLKLVYGKMRNLLDVFCFPGNTPTLGKPYGLTQFETSELVRVALCVHSSPVSKIVAIATKKIKREYPKLRLLISFADPSMGHNGAIYQAMNWIYCGMSKPDKMYFYQGRWQHSREIRGGAFGSSRKLKDYSILPIKEAPGKYRYLMPLDDAMRKQIEPLRKPYPKRGLGETDSAQQTNAETGGASPTSPLSVIQGESDV